jgi:ribosomal protein S18 acetylase RimI-like enzyme
METQIIRVGAAQAGLLAQVAEDVFDEPVDPRLLAAYLAEPGHLMVVAVTDGEVVGQARGMVHRHPDRPSELYIDNLGVTPPRQREHIATRLLDDLVAWGRQLGCEEAWVGTETDNEPARALYAGRGAEAEPFVMYAYEFESPDESPSSA